MNRRLMLLLVGAAFVVGVFSLGGCGNKEESASPTSSEGSSSTTTQQAHKLGMTPDTKAALDAAFEKSFKKSGAPGAVAAVRTPDGTWVGTLGVADRVSKEPMQADMHQRIGSVTKTFTVTLLLQAQADGLLSLDDTIDQYV